MQELPKILLTFRINQTAFSADIEKDFLQIELNEEDRDATRFLWLKDPALPVNHPDNIITYRFRVVLFGAAPSPFLLNATIQYHPNRKNDWISNDLKTSIYMDNVLSGTSTPQQAIEYYTSSRQYFKEAGMNLRQWTSNDDTINKMASQDGACAEAVTKVLGLVWNCNTDSLWLSLDKLIQRNPRVTVHNQTFRIKFIFQTVWSTRFCWTSFS